MKKFQDYLVPLAESETQSLDDEKAELIDFIKELDADTFAELMDVISSIMMDPTSLGDEDDETEHVEGDDKIIQLIDSGATPEDISSQISEAFSEDMLNERGKISAAERLSAAKLKKRNPKIRKLNRIKNAWRKKCKKRGLNNKKGDNGKWGCGKVDIVLAMKDKRNQHNRQKAVKAD